MKSFKFFLFSFCIITLSLTSCLQDECTEQREYVQYNPVYMTPPQFRVDIQTQGEKALRNPGKMYYYNNLLFINEMGEGVHIYDNSDSANPSYVTFYKIPGNFDIVIKNGLMVADNVIDLITIDITNIMNPEIIDRKKDYRERYTYWEDDDSRQYHAYSVASDLVQILDCSDSNFGDRFINRGNDIWFGPAEFAVDNNVITNETTSSGQGSGIGGSTARFTIVDDYFYAVDHSSLISYKFDNSAPVFTNKTNIGWGIETIFPYRDNLFIGSNAGMFIFSLQNPEVPTLLSTFTHARACDPVVVEGNTAYVTLRDGNTCEGFSNQLDVIDITSLTNPKLIKTYQMKNPHGLSVSDKTMYLSEGAYGLKVLDVADSKDIDEISWNKSITSVDVIYLGNDHLLSIGREGFYQYDVSDPDNIRELSRILVQ